jgi:hypothetical protein
LKYLISAFNLSPLKNNDVNSSLQSNQVETENLMKINIQKAINELEYQPISLVEGIEEVLGKNV